MQFLSFSPRFAYSKTMRLVIILSAIGCLVTSTWADLYSRSLLNYAALIVVRTMVECHEAAGPCIDMMAKTENAGITSVEKDLHLAQSLLQKSVRIDPNNGRSWWLLSVTGIALADKQTTIQGFQHALSLGTFMPMWAASHDSEYLALANLSYKEQIDWAQTITNSRMDYYQSQANQLAAHDQWSAAVRAMRMAFALAGEEISAPELEKYYARLAQSNSLEPTLNPLQLAKVMKRAGEQQSAKSILENLLATSSSPQEQSEGYLELGWLDWQAGFTESAIKNWKSALALIPSGGACVALALVGREKKEDLPSCSSLRPQYTLGIEGERINQTEPFSLTNGAQLVGYDVDNALLEISPAAELLLWWHLPADVAVPEEKGARVGEWWIQPYIGYNLAANSGFEWSGDSSIPLGYESTMFGTDSGRLEVRRTVRNGIPTHVLLLDNSQNPAKQMGIFGGAHRIQPGQLYLMASWVDETASVGHVGCWRRGENLGPYYIADTTIDYPVQEWIYYATAAILNARYFPNQNIVQDVSEPLICRPFILNFHSAAKTQFDNILIVRLGDLPFNH